MTVIYHTTIKAICWDDISRYIWCLSPMDANDIALLNNERDRSAGLMAKLLLLFILKKHCYWRSNYLPMLPMNGHGRPSLPGTDLDIYLTHTNDVVSCICSGTCCFNHDHGTGGEPCWLHLNNLLYDLEPGLAANYTEQA